MTNQLHTFGAGLFHEFLGELLLISSSRHGLDHQSPSARSNQPIEDRRTAVTRSTLMARLRIA
ncbi:hypothetical protein [Pseudonocardia sp. T1-2H]|uniref:hypothetical protein n=1 Tax=Pseudonocardia sp. T1-2H TaxID=3128899 RepID=UPI0031017932